MGNYLEENPLTINLTNRTMDLNTKIISNAYPYDDVSSGCRNLQ